MDKATIVGIDLAKRVFHLHGAAADGSVVFRKKLSRMQVLPFLAKQPGAVVAMEACASAHEWARQIGALGHEVKLIPPNYVKPFVKRQKNDAADAEAIAEAAARPTMRFVPVKTCGQQARAMLWPDRRAARAARRGGLHMTGVAAIRTSRRFADHRISASGTRQNRANHASEDTWRAIRTRIRHRNGLGRRTLACSSLSSAARSSKGNQKGHLRLIRPDRPPHHRA